MTSHVSARLTVNHVVVPPCQCDPTDHAHWSYDDMAEAIGRPLVPSDAIRVQVVNPGADRDPGPDQVNQHGEHK